MPNNKFTKLTTEMNAKGFGEKATDCIFIILARRLRQEGVSYEELPLAKDSGERIALLGELKKAGDIKNTERDRCAGYLLSMELTKDPALLLQTL